MQASNTGVVESVPVSRNPSETDPAEFEPFADGEATQLARQLRGRGRRHPAAPWTAAGILLGVLISLALLGPKRINVLLMGIDRAPAGTAAARTDTLILITALAGKPYVGMLSIPRDLWVEVDGIGPNRINTAHFFGESRQAGGGPQAALATVRSNFGIDVDRYIRLRFDSLVSLVDGLGGVDILLEQPAAGLQAGPHHLDGAQALAFVRSRADSDDFFRMLHGQMMVQALIGEMMAPSHWLADLRLVPVLALAFQTNLTPLESGRLVFALLRTGQDGIDGRTIDRSMVRDFTTAGGAQVLEPDWATINPILLEMFGQ
jgi:LCP family protein required for cell wall assembly